MSTPMMRALVVLAAWLMPAAALACPVCFDPNETARGAFFSTAIFLTILPLGMIVGAAWWLARRVRELDAAERASRRMGALEPNSSVR